MEISIQIWFQFFKKEWLKLLRKVQCIFESYIFAHQVVIQRGFLKTEQLYALYSEEMCIVIVSIAEMYRQQAKRTDKICKKEEN